jgi:hypothetical protein
LLLLLWETIAPARCRHLLQLHLLYSRSIGRKHLIHVSRLLQLLELVGVDLQLAELGVLQVYELAHG